jgi:hypothetical protein
MSKRRNWLATATAAGLLVGGLSGGLSRPGFHGDGFRRFPIFI